MKMKAQKVFLEDMEKYIKDFNPEDYEKSRETAPAGGGSPGGPKARR